jgi:hypothetical protein
MATIHLPPDLREFIKLLNSNHVEYLLIGGYAVGYHGYPRPTGDLDIWIAISSQNAARVVAALKEFGFDSPELSVQLFTRKKQVIQMGVSPIKIDISTTISGVSFNQCYAKRIVDELDGIQVNLINLKDLKTNKKASGRLKDLNDLENLP